MNRVRFSSAAVVVVSLAGLLGAGCGSALAQEHGRNWKPLPPTAHIVVMVEKGFNDKPIENAAVIFHATRDGKDDGNLEVKTDPQGRAVIDLIEVGSEVTVQVIAEGFATAARDLSVVGPTADLLVKMQSPRAQVSQYTDDEGKPSQVQPGVQQHVVEKPAAGAHASPAPAAAPAPQP
jgi:hypothetical protein